MHHALNEVDYDGFLKFRTTLEAVDAFRQNVRVSDFQQACAAILLDQVGEEPLVKLCQVMLDVGVPAIELPHERDRRVADLRDDLLGILRRQNGLLEGVTSPMPSFYKDVEPSVAVLVAGMNRFYLDLPESVFNVVYPESRVMITIPQLASHLDHLDHQGLLDLGDLRADGYGVLFVGQTLHYHQFLRKGLLGSINDGLMDILLTVGRREGNSVKVAIDDRRLTTWTDMRRTVEEDFWFGPHLTEKFLDDPYSDNSTVHRFPDDDAELGLGYEAIFAFWRMNGDVERVVQMEEFTAPGTETVGGLHALRYLRSI
jgi:hypothetical protein